MYFRVKETEMITLMDRDKNLMPAVNLTLDVNADFDYLIFFFVHIFYS